VYEPSQSPLREAPLRVTLAPDPVEHDAGRMPPAPLHVDDILRRVVELGGSDLHLAAGCHPTIRLRGELAPLSEYPVLDGTKIRDMLYAVLNQKQRERFENDRELDTSHSIPGVGRFRVNVLVQRDAVGSVMRVIPHEIVPLGALGVPDTVANFATLQRGLVLVTGPTGSGKSTTLASLIDLINSSRPLHIMTVEDPIEFLHHHKRAVVNQREVGEDTHSFSNALKHVLRQDPDVILVGEMRDLETISTALTAAETGHLVFATLHTQDAPQTVDRVIDVFPAHQQQQIRVQLATSLQGVVTQQLVPLVGGQGRTVATEIMVATPAIRNLIREGKVHQIYSSMQAGARFGMRSMDQSLAELVRTGKITFDVAVERAANPEDLRRLLGR
jgi:twitching motility protein PilT